MQETVVCPLNHKHMEGSLPRKSTPYAHPHDRQRINPVPKGQINRRTKGANCPRMDPNYMLEGMLQPTHLPLVDPWLHMVRNVFLDWRGFSHLLLKNNSHIAIFLD